MNGLKSKTEALKDEYNPWYPKYEYRPGQKAVVASAWGAIHKGYRFIALNLPTGWGKSVLGGALGNLIGGADICTTQISLQDQYLAFGDDYKRVMGRGNFFCKHDNRLSCDKGLCLTKDKFKCPYAPQKSGKFVAYGIKYWNFEEEEKHCPYWHQVSEAVNAKNRIFNYAYYILRMAVPMNDFPSMPIQVLDEAHKAEEYVRNVAMFEMKDRSLYHVRFIKGVDYVEYSEYDEIPVRKLNTTEKTVEWLRELKEIVEIRIESTRLASESGVEGLMRRRQMLEGFGDKITELLYWYEKDPKNWVRYDIRDGIKLIPKDIGPYAQQKLFRYSPLTVLMSATLPPKDTLCKRLGIDPEEMFYYSGDSIFPAENAPIYLNPKPVMKYDPNGMNKLRNIMGGSILGSIQERPEKKGLILCNSFQEVEFYSNYIRERDMNAYMRLTIHERGDKVPNVLEEHLAKPYSVMISPSCWEGLDLEGEKGEFCFVAKIPYEDFSDPLVKAFSETDKRRNFENACLKLRQGLGRVVRSPTDKVEIIIGDAGVKTLIRYNKEQFPEEVLKRLVYL